MTLVKQLVPVEQDRAKTEHHTQPLGKLSGWEKFRLSMTMTMGMDHSGLAGREMAKLMEEDIRTKFFVSLLLTIPIIAYSPLGQKILGLALPTPIPVGWLLFGLTTPVFVYGGWLFLYSAYFALKRRDLNMSVLIAVGITAAYLFSVVLTVLGSTESFYEAVAMLITFVLFGHWMEMKSRRGTTDALQALFALVPPQARVLRDGQAVLVPTSTVRVGDRIVLKPGDKVPVDGQVTEGETTIDESLVTGESLPVVKKPGAAVIGGSINQTGSITFIATKVGNDTALAQIVALVETAQNSKAPGQKLADQWARYLVMVAVGGGLLTFAFWYLVADQPLLFALTFAISAIVVACPDALGLATPTAVAVGTGLGAKHNILIKDAPTLEQVSKIQAIVLDKTGTLTEGKPSVTDVIATKGWDRARILGLSAAAEAKSNHPLSSAILSAAKRAKVRLIADVKNFENVSGKGVRATIDGQRYVAGTVKFMTESKIDLTAVSGDIQRLLDQGRTLTVVAVDRRAVGLIGATDQIKPTAQRTVARLKELGIETVMITGDNQQTADSVAKTLGLDRVFAGVLPSEKATYVKQLQKEGKFVAMVGDGVNDAPALAQANIGIAIGAGTDVAIETANVVLMKSDPADILRAIRLSQATVLKMKQNLFWASIYNLLAIPIAAGLLYPAYGIVLRPEWAALLMSISSIIVATNAVLLKRVERNLVSI